MKIKINYYMRSVIFLFLIFSSVFSISQSTYSLESENLNSENEILVCEKQSISSYLKFSNYLDIDHKDLQAHMTLNLDDKICSLIPLNDSEKYKIFFKKIFSFCDEEYMKFYGRGKCLSEQEAENDFQGA